MWFCGYFNFLCYRMGESKCWDLNHMVFLLPVNQPFPTCGSQMFDITFWRWWFSYAFKFCNEISFKTLGEILFTFISCLVVLQVRITEFIWRYYTSSAFKRYCLKMLTVAREWFSLLLAIRTLALRENLNVYIKTFWPFQEIALDTWAIMKLCRISIPA